MKRKASFPRCSASHWSRLPVWALVCSTLGACTRAQSRLIGRPEDQARPRVVGGETAPPSAYPFMAFISIQNLQGEVYSCGATLITPSVLLTAAHCIDDTPTNPVTTILVKLGVTNVQTSAGEVWQATDWFAHPAYNSTTYWNDIACIVIGGLSSYAPVTLDWGSRATDVGNAVVAIGFGQTLPESADYYWDYSPTSPTLQRIKEGILDIGWCGSKSNPVSGSYQLCAGDLSGGRGSCYGDSGGPILSTISDASDGWRTGAQVGIVSYGRGCGRVYGPGIYTRVSAYIPWLLLVVPLLPRPDTAVAAPALLQPHVGSAVCGAARIGWPLLIDCGALKIGNIITATWSTTNVFSCFSPAGVTYPADTSRALSCCAGASVCELTADVTRFGPVPYALQGLLATNSLSIFVTATCGVPFSQEVPPPSNGFPPPMRVVPAPPYPAAPVQPIACTLLTPSAKPPSPPPPSPAPPPPLSASLVFQLRTYSLVDFSPPSAPSTAPGSGIPSPPQFSSVSEMIKQGFAAVMPPPVLPAYLSVVLLEVAYTVNILVLNLDFASWSDQVARDVKASLCRDILVDRFQVSLSASRGSTGISTNVSVTVSQFANSVTRYDAVLYLIAYMHFSNRDSYVFQTLSRHFSFVTVSLPAITVMFSRQLTIGVPPTFGDVNAVIAAASIFVESGGLLRYILSQGLSVSSVEFTAAPTAPPSSPAPSPAAPVPSSAAPASSSSKTGIAVGVGIVVLVVLGAALWFWLRRREAVPDSERLIPDVEFANLAPARVEDMHKPMSVWSQAEVADFLEKSGFQQYVDVFKPINGATLSTLTDADMQELGMKLGVHRRALSHLIGLNIGTQPTQAV